MTASTNGSLTVGYIARVGILGKHFPFFAQTLVRYIFFQTWLLSTPIDTVDGSQILQITCDSKTISHSIEKLAMHCCGSADRSHFSILPFPLSGFGFRHCVLDSTNPLACERDIIFDLKDDRSRDVLQYTRRQFLHVVEPSLTPQGCLTKGGLNHCRWLDRIWA